MINEQQTVFSPDSKKVFSNNIVHVFLFLYLNRLDRPPNQHPIPSLESLKLGFFFQFCA